MCKANPFLAVLIQDIRDLLHRFLSYIIYQIIGKKQETGVKSLFSKGGTAVVKQDIDGLEAFELITFLIVR